MHETWETLSALKDGELVAAEADRARSHLAVCAECAAAYDRVVKAGDAFRRSGVKPMPAGLAARLRPGRASSPLLKLSLSLAVALLAVWVSGVAIKALMPTLFNNIQQMITGAASQMGSGGK